MMKKILLTSALFFCAFFLIAQEKSMTWADQSYQQHDYVSAIRHYTKALRKTSDFNEQKQIASQIALSYYAMNDYQQAAVWFEDALGDNGTDISLGLKYANALAAINQVDEAEQVLQYFLNLRPENNEIKLRLAVLKLFMNADTDSLGWVWALPDLNSEASDYGVSIWDNKLVFASTRTPKVSSRLDGRSGQGFSDLFYANTNALNESSTVPQLMPGVFNTSYNDGSFVFAETLNMAFWTVCFRKPDNCVLYQADYNPTSKKWSGSEKMPFMLEGFNYGHPFVAPDGNTLFFSSNMPGGYGQNDLWKITRKANGSWGIPVNLGSEINTSANEVFPSLMGDSILFFSSDRPPSLGGLDIYMSFKEKLFFTAPVRLFYPVNSAADDFGLVMKKSGNGGYFTSDRNPETSDDIYAFKGFPMRITVLGTVTHEKEKTPISGAWVCLADKNNLTDTVFTDKTGQYAFTLEALNEYRLSASAPTYYIEQRVINTGDISLYSAPMPEIRADFELAKVVHSCAISGLITNRDGGAPMPNVKVEINNVSGFSGYTWSDDAGYYTFSGLKPQTKYTVRTSMKGYFAESRICDLPKVKSEQVFNKANGYDMDFQLLQIQTQKEVTLNDIFYDYNKATLRYESMVELNKLASMLRETPGVVIQINSHTDARGRDEYNMELSAQRAVTVVNYLIAQGISRDRLIAKGWGERQLLIPNAATETEHQANRRTTFNVIDREAADDSSDEIIPEAIADEFVVEPVSGISGLEYRVQLLSSSNKYNLSHEFAKVYANIDLVTVLVNDDGNVYRYEAGSRSTLNEVSKLKRELRSLGYADCFVVPYYNGKRISMNEAKKWEKEEGR